VFSAGIGIPERKEDWSLIIPTKIRTCIAKNGNTSIRGGSKKTREGAWALKGQIVWGGGEGVHHDLPYRNPGTRGAGICGPATCSSTRRRNETSRRDAATSLKKEEINRHGEHRSQGTKTETWRERAAHEKKR